MLTLVHIQLARILGELGFLQIVVTKPSILTRLTEKDIDWGEILAVSNPLLKGSSFVA